MFTKEESGSFKYWFAHWCAFQMTALNLKRWKFKYIFHDVEKPWLRLFFNRDKVQKIHRNHSKHHLEHWMKYNNVDWEEMVIDWESCRFTKKAEQLNAREEFERKSITI